MTRGQSSWNNYTYPGSKAAALIPFRCVPLNFSGTRLQRNVYTLRVPLRGCVPHATTRGLIKGVHGARYAFRVATRWISS